MASTIFHSGKQKDLLGLSNPKGHIVQSHFLWKLKVSRKVNSDLAGCGFAHNDGTAFGLTQAQEDGDVVANVTQNFGQ